MSETVAVDEATVEAEPRVAQLTIAIVNETSLPLDATLIRSAVAGALATSTTVRTANVSVAVVHDAAIRRINAQFLGHDYATDVLSFVLVDEIERLDCEIVISADAAKRNATEAGWAPNDELLLYVVHGALHCCGFDDAAPDDAVKMRAEEVRVLQSIGVTCSPTDDRWRSRVAQIDDIGSEV